MCWQKSLRGGLKTAFYGTTVFFLSSSVLAEPVKENIGLYGGYVADIEAMDDAGTTEILIAVENSQRGVYRYVPASGGAAAYWESNPTLHRQDPPVTYRGLRLKSRKTKAHPVMFTWF